MNRYTWIYQPAPTLAVEELSSSLNLSKHFAECLCKRGVSTYPEAEAFFCPTIQHLHSPFLMKDMEKAVSRIVEAIERKEKILIYGDYDVDGTTSATLLYLFLIESLDYPKEQIDIYIPDRLKEGYGVQQYGVNHILQQRPHLVVMVDCGIASVAHTETIVSHHIDCIICDHHLPSEKLPPARAILNPKQSDCPYPYKELSACAIVYKLVVALAETLGVPTQEFYPLIDLVALSSAADIVPLTGENRVLMSLGLQELNQRKRQSLATLAESCGVKHYTVEQIVFALAPRINAAGRITHAKYAVELLGSQNNVEIIQLSQTLNSLNTERRQLQQEVFESANKAYLAKRDEFPFVAVVHDKAWFKGVIGIVASKIVEHHGKPCIVFAEDEDCLVGSGRSIPQVDLYKMLYQCREYIETFGGHRAAAGLKIKKENFKEFELAFQEAVKQELQGKIPTPQLEIDAEIPLSAITEKTSEILRRMEPFGPSNLNPLWMAKGVQLAEHTLIKEKHLRLIWAQHGTTHTSILFGQAERYLPHLVKGNHYDIAFKIKRDEWNGIPKLSLVVEDIRMA